jgi:anti-sigma-K factor RskA
MTDDRTTPDTLAGEYVLGLLTGEELHHARERLASDAGFRDEVARWEGRLAPLHIESESVQPPEDVWGKLEAKLVPPRANDNQRDFGRQLRVWKSFAFGMTAIAASLALVLIFEPGSSVVPRASRAQQPAPAPLVAMLASQGSMKVVASWNPSLRQLVLAVPGDMGTDPNHSNELWIIPAGGKPKSLGTMPDAKRMHMQLANALATLLQQGATIAISVEPRGGSPTGSPTGPVVASGALSRA